VDVNESEKKRKPSRPSSQKKTVKGQIKQTCPQGDWKKKSPSWQQQKDQMMLISSLFSPED
jgi:hypothetical protein